MATTNCFRHALWPEKFLLQNYCTIVRHLWFCLSHGTSLGNLSGFCFCCRLLANCVGSSWKRLKLHITNIFFRGSLCWRDEFLWKPQKAIKGTFGWCRLCWSPYNHTCHNDLVVGNIKVLLRGIWCIANSKTLTQSTII